MNPVNWLREMVREFLLNNFIPANNEQLSMSCNLLESNSLDDQSSRSHQAMCL